MKKDQEPIYKRSTQLTYQPIKKVHLDDLEVVKVSTQDLIGHYITIDKSDYSQVEVSVSKVSEQKIEVILSSGVEGTETNVWLTVTDNNGVENLGTLFVNPE
jgi:hypothetical protein